MDYCRVCSSLCWRH
uniref:Uncharacterized protein n=1 Tax=Saccharopolyspora erythraea TaxID=1836 RepID=Q54081_SACER|nr:unknown protein [Saccharopolyspora erythraea]